MSQHQDVQEYYGKILETSSDLKTNACCTLTSYPPHIKAILAQIHEEVAAKYYGCGLTIPLELEGLQVMDLGSGSGRDSYLLSKLVGPKGSITGVDMTPEQLDLAKKHIAYHTQAFGYATPNIRFLEGTLEELAQAGIQPESMDLAVSNCVINLVTDKKKVLAEVYAALKPGGEMYFSDVYTDRRIPKALAQDQVLYGECLSGALYWNDFLRIAKEVGFTDPRWMKITPIEIGDGEVQAKLEGYHFYSITCRLFKLPALEPNCEDYGQAVRYKGTLAEAPHVFELDSGHCFETGKLELVCGNSYRMLAETRFAKHFEFFGSFEKHYGIFPGCGESMPFNDASEGSSSNCGC